MLKEQQQVKEFMLKAGQECPTRADLPSEEVRRLRLKLIFEETVELANALGFCVNFDSSDITREPSWDNIVDTADALGDLLVVVLGSAVACGLNMQPIWDEIHRSNMTKFIDGYRREDGKWVKGPSYSPANLVPIVKAQSEPAPAHEFIGPMCTQCGMIPQFCVCNPL